MELVRVPIADALEHGLAKAGEYALAENFDDPWLSAHLVRFHARQHLVKSQANSWQLLGHPANAGIHLVLPGEHRVRVMSGRRSRLPNPGHSQTRRRYWSDGGYYQFSLFSETGVTDLPPLNLLVAWDAKANGTVSLCVAHPTGTWPYRGVAQCSAITPLASHFPEVELKFEVPIDEGEGLVELDVENTPQEDENEGWRADEL